jgi:cysteine-rich repeat protein
MLGENGETCDDGNETPCEGCNAIARAEKTQAISW